MNTDKKQGSPLVDVTSKCSESKLKKPDNIVTKIASIEEIDIKLTDIDTKMAYILDQCINLLGNVFICFSTFCSPILN